MVMRKPDGTYDAVRIQDMQTAIQAGLVPVPNAQFATLQEAKATAARLQQEGTESVNSAPRIVNTSSGTGATRDSLAREAFPNQNRMTPDGSPTGPTASDLRKPTPANQHPGGVASQTRDGVVYTPSGDVAPVLTPGGTPLMSDDGTPTGVGTVPENVNSPLNQDNPFAGTWASGEGQNAVLAIGNGQMTAPLAVQRMLAAQGLGPVHAQQGYLQQLYQDAPFLNQMANPGAAGFDPLEAYGKGGQYAVDSMNPSNGYNYVDSDRLWDNVFSDQGVETANRDVGMGSSGNPVGDQLQAVQGAIKTLSPYIGEMNTNHLNSLTNSAYLQYQNDMMDNKISPSMTFASYLKAIGAGDWM